MKYHKTITGILSGLLLVISGVNYTSAVTLRELAAACGIRYGTCDGPLTDAPFAALMARECNIITAQNCLKFNATEPQQNQFSFGTPDALAQFCRQNNIEFRGHCLIWHEALPSWVTNGTFDRQQMLAIMKNHITTVVGRYKGQIKEWDVVNEGIDYKSPYGLRSTVWRTRIGDDYLDSAFAYAHAADPQALLFYNDFSTEGMNVKSDSVYNLVKRLKERGVPIHGVGLQCHMMVYANLTGIDENMKRLGSLGLKVSITEAEFTLMYPVANRYLLQQGTDYKNLMGICLANRPVCTTFVTWGISDRYFWQPLPNYGDGMIFDRDLQPKPAFDSLVTVMTEAAPVTEAPRVLPNAGIVETGQLFTITGMPAVHGDKTPGIFIVHTDRGVSKVLVIDGIKQGGR